ncbi:MAG: hypothetical protein Q9160_004428 [Pyrenula sp. 1 TL-2023]
MSEAPTLLLTLAATLYLVGFGIYLLYRWLYHAGDEPTNSRNVFIMYVIVVEAALVYIFMLWFYHAVEEQKRNLDFRLDEQHLGSEKPEDLLQLEEWLDELENWYPSEPSTAPRYKTLETLQRGLEEKWEVEGGEQDLDPDGLKEMALLERIACRQPTA